MNTFIMNNKGSEFRLVNSIGDTIPVILETITSSVDGTRFEGYVEDFRKTTTRNINRNTYRRYFYNDIEPVRELHEKMRFTIKKVIFNDPATIVFWADGSKTVVKCQEGDIFDPEKGLAMAISKRALGDKGNFNDVFKKWVPEEESLFINLDGVEFKKTLENAHKAFVDSVNAFAKIANEHFPPTGTL